MNSGIINILPDNIANQIAAGEVIQRPASVVKELLENAVDAEATKIQLIVKDAGKTLIQVIDNGKGMNDRDARVCFERHATSKLKTADDLFSLKTKGFRGEALASIAAISQVELKTKIAEADIGTLVVNEGCIIKEQTSIAWERGTSVAVKNLFYNVPARRNFLKNDSVEFAHIVEEFTRVALAHPEIEMSLQHNNQPIYSLAKGSLKQRIVGLMGSQFNSRIAPLSTETTVVTINGFIGKPEYAKKKKGEQYFFVNKRFIKSSYLNHAVVSAYEGLIPHETAPAYFIFLEVNPSFIDVNIHPTKTEIKFEDEKTIYSLLRAAVRMAISKSQLNPSIDFEVETGFNFPPPQTDRVPEMPKITINPNYNPFNTPNAAPKNSAGAFTGLNKHANPQNWQSLYEIVRDKKTEIVQPDTSAQNLMDDEKQENIVGNCFQLQSKYIVTHLKSGLFIIDQHLAHERILFEKYLNSISSHPLSSQQLLFPFNINLTPGDYSILNEQINLLKTFGFNLVPFGGTTFNVTGIPLEMPEHEAEGIICQIMNELKENQSKIENKGAQIIAQSMASSMAIKYGKSLTNEEMIVLIGELFACSNPYSAPNGKKILINFTIEEILKRFNQT